LQNGAGLLLLLLLHGFDLLSVCKRERELESSFERPSCCVVAIAARKRRTKAGGAQK
jgi:hypothetical protein